MNKKNKKSTFIKILVVIFLSLFVSFFVGYVFFIPKLIKSNIEKFLKENDIKFSHIKYNPILKVFDIKNLEISYFTIFKLMSEKGLNPYYKRDHFVTLKADINLKIKKSNLKNGSFVMNISTNKISTLNEDDKEKNSLIEFPSGIKIDINRVKDVKSNYNINANEFRIYDLNKNILSMSKNLTISIQNDLQKQELNISIDSSYNKKFDQKNIEKNEKNNVDFKFLMSKKVSGFKNIIKVDHFSIKSPIYNILIKDLVLNYSNVERYLSFDLKANNYKYFLDESFNNMKLSSGYRENVFKHLYKNTYHFVIPKIRSIVKKTDSKINEDDLSFAFLYDSKKSINSIYINNEEAFKLKQYEK